MHNMNHAIRKNLFFHKIGCFDEKNVENSVETVENSRSFQYDIPLWNLVENAFSAAQFIHISGRAESSVRNGAAGRPFFPNSGTSP